MIGFPENIMKYIKGRPFEQDKIGMSGSSVYVFDDLVLKIENDTKQSKEIVNMIKWLKNKIPVPEVICHEISNNKSFLLMSKIKGKMACDDYYLENSNKLLFQLSKAFKMLWSVDITDCPRIQDIDTKLKEARFRVEKGLVDINSFNVNGFSNPTELLIWLENNKPDYEPVLSHGDLCLPNILIESDEISGFIDLGHSGVSDKWVDISLCYKSLKNNFNGTFGGKIYPEFEPNKLFEYLHIQPNMKKIKYFILLDELF
jgi:aminoglycoside phosphotransferase